ncbi:hypothetical protein MRX96_023877 [Rhipicephalus microplus]
MLQPSSDSTSKGTMSSSPTIKEQQPLRSLCGPRCLEPWHQWSMRHYSTTTQIKLPFRLSWLRRSNAYRHPTSGCSSHHGFRIERDTVKFANYKGAATITTALWLGGCTKTMSSNKLVFAVHMITDALCHVLLPLAQTVCTVAPIEHAPLFYHYPNKIAVPLVLASPEERISTSYYWMLQ